MDAEELQCGVDDATMGINPKIRENLKDVQHDLIKVFVYGSQYKFNSATGLKENTKGTSRGPNEFHFVWTNWFNSIFI